MANVEFLLDDSMFAIVRVFVSEVCVVLLKDDLSLLLIVGTNIIVHLLMLEFWVSVDLCMFNLDEGARLRWGFRLLVQTFFEVEESFH
jgi:hypothetical protein